MNALVVGNSKKGGFWLMPFANDQGGWNISGEKVKTW